MIIHLSSHQNILMENPAQRGAALTYYRAEMNV